MGVCVSVWVQVGVSDLGVCVTVPRTVQVGVAVSGCVHVPDVGVGVGVPTAETENDDVGLGLPRVKVDEGVPEEQEMLQLLLWEKEWREPLKVRVTCSVALHAAVPLRVKEGRAVGLHVGVPVAQEEREEVSVRLPDVLGERVLLVEGEAVPVPETVVLSRSDGEAGRRAEEVEGLFEHREAGGGGGWDRQQTRSQRCKTPFRACVVSALGSMLPLPPR